MERAMMENKTDAIRMLQEEFERWEKLLAGLSEEQMNVPLSPSTFSIKDTLAHLMAWQQVSIARLEAAQFGGEPVYLDWSQGKDPDEEGADDEGTDRLNANIHQLHQKELWRQVYHEWRDGYLRFLLLAEATPEEDLLDTGKYRWLKGYPLLGILEGHYEHHHIDHLEPLIDWLRQHGIMKPHS
jgi:hypothetical protein